VSAADRREELEAYVWRLFARRSKFPPGQLVASILVAADRYAEAVADERIAGHVTDRIHGPERLAEAVAESYRRRTVNASLGGIT
jgi:hypothetical protein